MAYKARVKAGSRVVEALGESRESLDNALRAAVHASVWRTARRLS